MIILYFVDSNIQVGRGRGGVHLSCVRFCLSCVRFYLSCGEMDRVPTVPFCRDDRSDAEIPQKLILARTADLYLRIIGHHGIVGSADIPGYLIEIDDILLIDTHKPWCL